MAIPFPLVGGSHCALRFSVQTGYQNTGGLLRGPVEVRYEHEAFFHLASLRFELSRFDFHTGFNYLTLNSKVETLENMRTAGFGDPFVGGTYYFLYENRYLPELGFESELMLPWGTRAFSLGEYVNRSRVLMQKSNSGLSLGLSFGYLVTLHYGARAIGLYSARLSTTNLAPIVLGFFGNYQERTLRRAVFLAQGGLWFGYVVTGLELYTFWGRETHGVDEGWFFGAGMSVRLYQGRM